jgi:hypothetical protein
MLESNIILVQGLLGGLFGLIALGLPVGIWVAYKSNLSANIATSITQI